MNDYLTIVVALLATVAGALITLMGEYQIERRHSKKEMEDRIYGPMFRETRAMSETLKTFGESNYTSIPNQSEWRNDYLFFTIGQDLERKWFELMEILAQYQTIRYAAQSRLDDATKRYVEITNRTTLTGGATTADYYWLRLLLGKPMARSLNLRSAIFLKMTAQDFIKKEKEKWGEEMQVDVSLPGFRSAMNTQEEFEKLYNSMLEEMDKDPLYQMEQKQRTYLLKKLESFLGQIEPFIKPKYRLGKRVHQWYDYIRRTSKTVQ